MRSGSGGGRQWQLTNKDLLDIHIYEEEWKGSIAGDFTDIVGEEVFLPA